ncbi:MAG: nucleotidyltransferase domain-containing protein [Spirochaetes bacterium]|nr:nucleotidyltransferase domain-containing protein [Spirochaetota bacterium]
MSDEILSREAILLELKRRKAELSRRYGITRLGLFGSYARGEAKAYSDIDVVVELAEPDLFALVHVKEALEEDFRKRVDIVPYGPFTNESLKARINREAVYV